MLIEQKVSALSRMWGQAVCAAMEGGSSGTQAVGHADEVALAYQARFGEHNEDHTGAGVALSVAVKYYERHWLIGQSVIVVGQADVPSVGSIKDFSNGTHVFGDSALVVWTSGAPSEDEESWVPLERLQLICKID